MKFLKRLFKWLFSIIGALILLAYATDYDYILKGIRVVYFTGHTTAYIDDLEHFDYVTIEAGDQHQPWPLHADYNKSQPTERLTATHKEMGSVAFMIIKNDSIWYEWYDEEFGGADAISNSFSMAKTMISALLGKAIMDGYVESLDQPVGDFITQYDGDATTMGDLSSMASGLDWDESYKSPFSVTARAYYDDDLASTILKQKVVEEPGQAFKYLSGNTQLLAMALEEATGKKMPEYLSESFWKPMGFSQNALWQVDDDENKLVKAYCCVTSTARDFARFGKLYKDHGRWNGQQILDSVFVAKSITARFEESPQYGYGLWLSDHQDKDIFVLRGILGQYVITIPKDDVIIVRLGHRRGEKTDRPFASDFYVYVEEAYTMLEQAGL